MIFLYPIALVAALLFSALTDVSVLLLAPTLARFHIPLLGGTASHYSFTSLSLALGEPVSLDNNSHHYGSCVDSECFPLAFAVSSAPATVDYLPPTLLQASEYTPAPSLQASFASWSGTLYHIPTIVAVLAAMYYICMIWVTVSVPFFSCVADTLDLQQPNSSWSLDSPASPVKSLCTVRHPSTCAPQRLSFDGATQLWDLVPVSSTAPRRAQAVSRPVLLILPPPPPLSLPPSPTLPPSTPPLPPPTPLLPPPTQPLTHPTQPLPPSTQPLPQPTPSLLAPTSSPPLPPPPTLPLPPPTPPLPPPEPPLEIAKKKRHRGTRGGKREQHRKINRALAAEAAAQSQQITDAPQDPTLITDGTDPVVVAHDHPAIPAPPPPPKPAPAAITRPAQPWTPPPKPHLAPRHATPSNNIIGRSYSHYESTPRNGPAITTLSRWASHTSPPLATVPVRVLPPGKLNQRARRAHTAHQTLGSFLAAS
ncbi:hypothetical protein VTO73DRAFT_4314 [Trametes versicolor]